MKYSFTTTIGIDVSKHTLDVFCHGDGTHAQFSNSPEDISRLMKWIKQRAEESLVIIEPTGGYERMVQHIALTTKGVHIAKVNARQIREFARAKGRIAKTDKIDASILAEYGIAMRPRILALPPVYRQKLSALVKRRQQLTNTSAREKTRIEQTDCSFAKQSIKEVITFLRQQVIGVDAATRELIKSHEELHDAHQVIKNVKGIGPVTAAILLAELPELGRIGNKAISSLLVLLRIMLIVEVCEGKDIFTVDEKISATPYIWQLSAQYDIMKQLVFFIKSLFCEAKNQRLQL